MFGLVPPLFSQQIIVKFKQTAGLNASGANRRPPFPAEFKRLLQQEPALKAAPFIRFPESGAPAAPFGNVVRITAPRGANRNLLLAQLRKMPGVEYAEINHRYRLLQEPDDPGLAGQWYLSNINAFRAWEIEKGKPGVIVGIIDTGVDYLHPDLRESLWVNSAEDLNGNGRRDSLDFNGVDDDGNGYVDDVIGWDFTDAPDFPDTGDYLRPDNDPMDEFQSGHGTGIAGIIAAQQDNGVGISGIAPGARFMILRAGTASGFLEEDDVAEAVVYAVKNGCRIINMSFGDPAFSFLLRDAIEFARQNGVLVVAAAGNNGNTQPMYPAAFNATLAVGATDSQNRRTTFSTYGDFIDLVAPGQDILTTEIGGSYGALSGTSFSAPMVSAAAALIWSRHPDFSTDEVKGAMLAGANSAAQGGWSPETGHGLLNLFRSLTISGQGMAAISFPSPGSGLSGPRIAIRGTVFSPFLREFDLFYRTGTLSGEWLPVAPAGGFQAVNDTLAMWDISGLPDSTYTLELRMHQEGLKTVTDRIQFRIDRTPPQLTNFQSLPVFSGNSPGNLIIFRTDDPTRASLLFSGGGPSGAKLPFISPVVARTHTFVLTPAEASPSASYEIQLKNDAGLTSVDDNSGNFYRVNFAGLGFPRNVLESNLTFPFSGYFMPALADLDGDQHPEILLSEFNDVRQFGKMQVWERSGNNFTLRWESERRAIPRDAADIEGDGKTELLAGFGGTTMLFDAAAPGQLPTHLAWIDSGNFWGSRLVNLDADPRRELLAIRQGVWTVFRVNPAHDGVTALQELTDPTEGGNQLGIPRIAVADFNDDGFSDIAYGDLDGDMVVYAGGGSGFQFLTSIRLKGEDATSLLTAGDFDGDGAAELAVATKVLPAVKTESTVRQQYWQLSVLKFSTPGGLAMLAGQKILGVQVGPKIINGLSSADVDRDGEDEIFFLPFPNLYLFHLENSQLVLWGFEPNVMSSAALPGPNGTAAVWVNSVNGVREFRTLVDFQSPPPPFNLKAAALDTNQIRISWQPLPGAEYYKIYRQVSGNAQFRAIDSIASPPYVDANVTGELSYSYAVSQVDRTFPQKESPRSDAVKVRPHLPPELTDVRLLSDRSVRLVFSRPMGKSALLPRHYRLLPSGNQPLTIFRGRRNRAIFLNFDPAMPPEDSVLMIRQISDSSGAPLRGDSLRIFLHIPPAEDAFYVKEVVLESKRAIIIRFNKPVDPVSAEDIGNYNLEPDGVVKSAEVAKNDPTLVRLSLEGQNTLGALGVPHFLTIVNVRDISGVAIVAGEGNRLAIQQDAPNLARLVVYPNPFRFGSARNQLVFGNLPRKCEILIYSASGRLIRKLIKTNNSGGLRWDLKTSRGNLIASGVYVYFARSGSETRRGKFLVIR